MRGAKIVCTLGPATSDPETVRAMAEAGMSVARVNASHGDPATWREHLERVRAVASDLEAPVATMLDLQGPEVRTAALDPPVTLAAGETVAFVPESADVAEREGAEDSLGNESDHAIPVSPSLAGVTAGDRILLDDGRVEATVTATGSGTVQVRVAGGGELAGRVGLVVPGVELDLQTVSASDREALALAAELDVDFVAASFVRRPADVLAVSEVLEEHGADVPIVAKIERAGALDALAGIVETAYAVMVARGDLGVECPMEQVPMIQKRIIRRCHEAGRPVITATEMLESMVESPRPTRAEASDVANAVLDGTDAVMLSAETAVGADPVRAIEAMARIVREVEASEEYAAVREERVPPAGEARSDALARSARYLARDVDAAAVVVATESGFTALRAAKFRPGVPVVAATPSEPVRRRLALSWGVIPRYVSLSEADSDAVLGRAVQAAIEAGAVETGDTVVVLSGMMTALDDARTTNVLKLHIAAEALGTGRVIVEGHASGPIARAPDGDLSGIPDGAVLVLGEDPPGEFLGDLGRIGAVVAAGRRLTGYHAMVARELGVPMIGGVGLPSVPDGTAVTVDGERGVVYEGVVDSTPGA